MSLLGAVLIDEEVLADISEVVTAKDFYDKRHMTVYAAMMRLYEHHKPVDLLTLSEELKKKDRARGGRWQRLFDRTNQLRPYRGKCPCLCRTRTAKSRTASLDSRQCTDW